MWQKGDKPSPTGENTMLLILFSIPAAVMAAIFTVDYFRKPQA
jgi:hypothetical protein